MVIVQFLEPGHPLMMSDAYDPNLIAKGIAIPLRPQWTVLQQRRRVHATSNAHVKCHIPSNCRK